VIFAFPDDRFATDILFKTAFGFSDPRSRAGANVALPIGIAQFALEDLATGLSRQRIEELDLLRNLEIGEASSGMPNTAQSRTPAMPIRAFSISAG